jgi:sentrin-specific protease 1
MLLEAYRQLVQATVEFSRNVFRMNNKREELVREEQKIRQAISLTDVALGPIPESALKPKPPPPRPAYMLLSNEDRLLANMFLAANHGGAEVVTEINNIELTKEKLVCLDDKQWLNDEVINGYFDLLRQHYAPRVYLWNSFFWLKLSNDGNGYNYKAVQRWTTRKKIDIFSVERMIVPMNIGKNHWALGVVDLKNKKIQYFDSLAEGCVHNGFANYMKKYLTDEWKDKKPDQPAPDFFEFETPLVYPPQQSNSFDCGVFTCMNAECLAAGRDWLDFDQTMIPDMRRKILQQIRNNSIA